MVGDYSMVSSHFFVILDFRLQLRVTVKFPLRKRH